MSKLNPILLLFLPLTLGLMLVSCREEIDLPGTLPLQVKYFNASGFDISGLNVGGQQIGFLGEGEATSFIPYDTYGFDTGMPDMPTVGMVNGDSLIGLSSLYWCGTEKTQVTEGLYEIEIEIIQSNGFNGWQTYLNLRIRE